MVRAVGQKGDFSIPPKTIQCNGLRARVGSAVRACFEWLRVVFLFPFRYLGSKTWSIPGVILRAPWLCVKRIFTKFSLQQELFGAKYQYFFEKNLGPEELRPYLPYACAIAFVASVNPEYRLSGWNHIYSPDLNLPEGCSLNQEGYVVDSMAGFKSVILEKGGELIIAFRAMKHCLKRDESDPKKPVRLPSMDPEAKNLVSQLAGLKPALFERASSYVKHIGNLPQFRDKKITVAGQCHGGTIASYAGIANGIPAICFNTCPLGVGLQEDLGKDRLDRASDLVTHICIEGDFLTDHSYQAPLDVLANGLGLRTPGNFGKKFRIPSAYSKGHDKHVFSLGSVMKHLGYPVRTLPKEIAL